MSILEVQRILSHLGYDPGEHDGLDGPNTQAAVKAFQRKTGIEADGIVGPVTRGHLAEAYKDSRASEHFAMGEYQCDCGGMYCAGFPELMEEALLTQVENLRNRLGRPVIITSSVRCTQRNREVGGIEHSKHKIGCAADLYCPGVHYSEVAAVARDLGLGVIEYPEQLFVHVEV